MSRNSNQLSVAELLARNGQQPASGSGGRRRRGGRGLSVDDLSGDLPAVESGGSAHAAPDAEDTEYPADAPPEYSAGADGGGETGYAAEGYPGGPVSYAAPDPNNSPMSGPITVYNPLEPYRTDSAVDGAPARLGDPAAFGSGQDQFPPAEDAPRAGRRRRADADDEFAGDGYFANDPGPAAPANQPSDSGPPTPGGGRAARRRAAEAAAAVEFAPAAPEPEPSPHYGWPPEPGDFGGPPASTARPEFGGPDAGPSWPTAGFDGGPPRLGPPGAAPPTEAWQAPSDAPPDDSRPKLERRRRGARPLPEPESWPEPPNTPDPAIPNGDQTTVVWSPGDQGMRLRAGLQGLETPPHDGPGRGEFRGPGPRNGRAAGPGPVPPDLGAPAPGFGPDPDFGRNDIYATDIHGPMRPLPDPGLRDESFETGDFEPEYDPDYDDYDDPDDADRPETRADRARAALTGKLGAAGGKFAATRSKFAAGARRPDTETIDDPRKQWMILGAQSVGAAIAGMLAFKGFELLWEAQPLAALALAVVVILGLVALVRILRRGDDMFSTVIAVVVGVFVTLGPLAFLLSTG
ncbi:hypothetical protein [Nocardia sp. NBC_00416]|uniref:hypothetical protein n=1 Tax=Nocardia sp. NBC_00416 TaxID=2975991 RepID=UPI002E243094